MPSAGRSAWLFVMKSDAERSWAANRGYDDSAGIYYSYDSNVGRSKQVAVGDLIVVRHDDYIAGWGIVDSIDVDLNATKEIKRCPRCRQTRWRERANRVPHVKCDHCDAEFEVDDLLTDVVSVVAYRANYAASWCEAVRPVTFRDQLLRQALTTTDTFNAIRPLDEERLAPLLEHISGRHSQRHMTAMELATELVGGHALSVVRRRRGQREFRFKMMERFGERCAFTGDQPPQTLEAAHLYSYARNPVHSPTGGLLLRRDHHALFDANLVTVNPSTWRVEIAPTLRPFETYAAVEGAELLVPRDKRPDRALLAVHYRESQAVFEALAC